MAHKSIGYGAAEEPANQNSGQKSRDGAYLCNDAAQCSCDGCDNDDSKQYNVG